MIHGLGNHVVKFPVFAMECENSMEFNVYFEVWEHLCIFSKFHLNEIGNF